jgi:hypothetical protein
MFCGTPVVSINVSGLADMPTMQFKPTPEDVNENLLIKIENRNHISRDQMQIVRTTFNMENWRNPWVRVILCINDKHK